MKISELKQEVLRLEIEILSLKDRVLGYQETIKSLQGSLRSAEKAKARQEDAYGAALAEKDAIITIFMNVWIAEPGSVSRLAET